MSLPLVEGAVWKLKASVGFDFLNGGALGYVIHRVGGDRECLTKEPIQSGHSTHRTDMEL